MRKLHYHASRLYTSLLTVTNVWAVALNHGARQFFQNTNARQHRGFAFFVLFMVLGSGLLAQTRMVSTAGADVGDCTGAPCLTINYAILQANPGDDILIDDGTYNENVDVNKNDLFFHSINGAGAVTVAGAPGGATGTFRIDNVTGTTIGDFDEGLTIEGYDVPTPAIEHAAIYARGDWSNTTIRDNIITADGEAGFLSEFGSTGTNAVVDFNTFDGQTFVGPEPAGCGFGMQFTLLNVPRQLAVFGPNYSNVTFTNNRVIGTAGGFNSADGCAQGNTLVTIDSDISTITNNEFAGTTSRFATSLRVRGDAASISCNVFDNSGLMDLTAHMFIDDANGDPLSGATPNSIAGIAQDNFYTTDGAYVDPPGRPDAGMYPYYIYKTMADAMGALVLYNAPARTATSANTTVLGAGCCEVLDFTRNTLNHCSDGVMDFTITNTSGGNVTFDLVFEDANDPGSFPKDLTLENALPYNYMTQMLAPGASLNTVDLIPAPAIVNEDMNFDRGRVLMGITNITPDNPSPVCMYDDIGPGTGLGLGSVIYPDPVIESPDAEICSGESVDLDVDLSFPSMLPAQAGYPVEITWTSVNNPNVAGNSDGTIQIYDAAGAETQVADITDVLVNGGVSPELVEYTITATSAGADGVIGTGDDCTGDAIMVTATVYPEISAALGADRVGGCFDFANTGGNPTTDYDLSVFYLGSTTLGGTWAYVAGPGGSITNNTFTGGPGCHTLEYAVDLGYPGANPLCVAMTDEVQLLLTEEPQPDFDLADAVCWDGVAGSLALPSNYVGQTFGDEASRSYAWTVSLTNGAGPVPTFSDAMAMEPTMTVQGAGEFEVCLTETLTYMICGAVTAGEECSLQQCHTLIVNETTVEVDASWTTIGPFCEDNATCIDLDALVTGTSGGEFTGTGVSADPSAPDYCFDPSAAGPGVHSICYTVNNGAGCTAVECHNITVYEEVNIDLLSGFAVCEIPRGDGRQPAYDLSVLLNAGTTPGGTWSLVSGPGNIVNGFITGNAGCYEVSYTVSSFPGAPGGCSSTASTFVRLTEQPTPDFDISEEVCWDGIPGSIVLNSLYNGSTFGFNGTVNYDWTATLVNGAGPIPSFSSTTVQEPLITIEGAGEFEICLSESLDYPVCGGLAPMIGYCPQVKCHTLTVTETTVEVDASWIPAGPFCEDDASIDLDALVTGTADGEFSGTGVSPDPSAPDYIFDPAAAGPGVHSVCYTVNNGAGCTAVECHNITVYESANISLLGGGNFNYQCQLPRPSGLQPIFDLSLLLNPGTTPGGTWTVLSGPGSAINGFISGTAGCYEVQYSVSTFAGADGACSATATTFLRLREQPNPDFDLAEEVCWDGVAGSQVLSTLYDGNTFGNNATINYDWTVSLLSGAGPVPTFSSSTAQEPTLTIQGAGVFEVCLTESMDYPACGGLSAITDDCPITECHLLTVTETTVEVDASWIPAGPFCEDDASIDLDALVTGTADGEFSGTGVSPDPSAPDYIFDPAAAGPGVHNVCYTVNNGAGCTAVECHNITVYESANISLLGGGNFNYQCQLPRPSGLQPIFDLSLLLNPGTTPGGTWTVLSGPGSAINGFISGTAGCYEVQYSVSTFAGADGACSATATTFLRLREQPNPDFDLAEEVCWDGVAGSQVLSTLYDGNTFGNNATINYDWTVSLLSGAGPVPTFSSSTAQEPTLTIQGAGVFEVCLTESMDYPACGGLSAITDDCPITECHLLTVTETTVEVDASWIPAGPFCEDDASIDLDALVTGTADGEFSGTGVSPDPSAPDYIFDPAAAGPGVHNVCYTVNNGAGCTAVECHTIEVYGAVDATIGDVHIECADPSGSLALTSLFNPGTTPGGEWRLVGAPAGATLNGDVLVYTEPGCYRLAYEVSAFMGADGACTDADNGFVLISEQPEPSFDLAEQVCWDGTPGSVVLPTLYNGQTNGINATRTYSWTVTGGPGTLPTFSSTTAQEPTLTIQGAGTFEVCIEEDLEYAACGNISPGSCSATVCHVVTVTETAVEVDASWTSVAALCQDDGCLDLDALVTGDADGVFSGQGVIEDPSAPDYCFDPSAVAPGSYNICYTVNNGAGCTAVECHTIEVYGPANIDFFGGGAFTLLCEIPRGDGRQPLFDLSIMLNPGSTPGGTWTALSGPGRVVNGFLSGTAGCYELEYSVESAPGLDGACATSETMDFRMTEEPTPGFDLAEQVCWDGVAGSITLPSVYNGNTFGNNATINYDWSATLIAGAGPVPSFTNPMVQEPGVVIEGAGQFEICLTESLDYPACGSISALTDYCAMTVCHTLTVTETAVEVDASWMPVGPYCEDDAREYLGAASGGMGAGQVTGNTDGVFTGQGVVEDPAASGEFYFDPTVSGPGSFDVCYTVNNGAGCTAVECYNIEVGEAVEVDCQDNVVLPCATTPLGSQQTFGPFSSSLFGVPFPQIVVLQSNYTLGTYSLDGLLCPGTTTGGEWTLVSDAPGSPVGFFASGAVQGSVLYYTAPGCYEVNYSVSSIDGLDGACVADQNFFVTIGESPKPSFDLPNEVCWSSGGPTLIYDIEDDYLTSPDYVNAVTRSYSSSDAGVASVNGDGEVTINGAGTATICMVEFIATSECDGFDFTSCQVEVCEVMTVFETSTTVNPTWTPTGPYCTDDARVYLGANENGMGCGLVTGTCGGVFTGQGVVEDPAGSEEYYFDPTLVSIPTGQEFAEVDVCYTVNNGAGCTATECHAIRVYAPVSADLIGDATLGCQNFNNGAQPFIYFDLNRLLGPGATVGGTWTATNGSVNGNILIAVPGCTEITYTVEAFDGADGSCTDTEMMSLRLVENPTPSFDMAEEICWDGVPGSVSIPTVYNGQTFGDNGTILYDWTVTTVSGGPAPTITNPAIQEPMVEVQGAGAFEICLTESIEYPVCGSMPQGEFCQVTTCHTLTITETSVEVLPTWTPVGPYCEDDARVYLGANEAGMGCGLVTGTCDGVFTGEGVVEDPGGSGEYYFDPTLVMIPMDEEFEDVNVCYTVNNGAGCTATECHNIRVYAAVSAAMNDIHIECQVEPSGNVDLVGLLTPPSTQGGTFTLLSGPATGQISNSLLIYSEAGCYEIEYTVTAFDGADDACTATTTGFVLVTEQPQPNFDIQDQACFSDGDADLVLTPLVNSPQYDAGSIVSTNWDVTDNVTGATVTIDQMTGEVTISDDAGPATITGTFEVCYVEEIDWADCGSFAATTVDTDGDGCSESICMIVNVEDGTALDAGFTVDNDEPCPGDLVNLTANTSGGVFTGLNVTDNGDGQTGTLQIDSCGTYAVTYTISSPNGCTNSLTLNIGTDRTPPTVVAPADTTVDCDGMGNIAEMEAWIQGVTGSDNCTFRIDTILFNRLSGCSQFTGSYVYQFVATDTCGNQSTDFGTFTVQDTTPPEIVGGADMLMEECTTPPAGNFPEFDFWLESNAGATATDECGGRVFWSNDFDPANWIQVCGNARYVDVTFYAEDECSNVDSIMHRFAIGDVTPPVFTNCPRDIITAAAPPTWCESFVNFSPPAATDNCSSVTLTRLDNTGLNSGDLFPVGITVLTWEARDSCDNADTCSLKIVVNDYHTPPTIGCPGDASATNDLGLCGADVSTQLGIDLSPVDITDNCPDNLAVIYEVEHEGEIIECGIESVNGFVFPVGNSTVTYRVQDQPILLITEIVQDGPDAVEVTNFGPASLDISCLVIERNGAGAETHVVPINTILMAGETYVADLMNDIGYNDLAAYSISLKGTILDQIMTNNNLEGGDIWRTRICDHDTEEDWLVTVECKASLGMVNPGLPVFPSNGTQTGIQTVLPSFATCSFDVDVTDDEAPVCAMVDTTQYAGPEMMFTGQECVQSVINVPVASTIGGIVISDLQITYPELGDLAASLIGPDGTEVELFYRPCTNVSDMLASFADSAPQPMSGAGCTDPLNTGLFWQPEEAFKAFYGTSAQGDWTLELSVDGVEMGQLVTGWSLDIIELMPFDDSPVVINVDPNTAPDMCGDTLTWLHPVLQDNCCEGTMTVEYSTLDADTLPMGGPVMSGEVAMAFFGLGTTTVKYTLTDEAGNMTMCSFDVIVEDPLGLCVPPCMSNCNVSCIQDLNVSLNENCIVPVVPSMVSEAIREECNFYYEIEILDYHGNVLPSDTLDASHVGECWTVRLIEPECGNSCWTEICVEDKFPPVIECRDQTLSCVEYQNNFAEPTAIEHCGNYTVRLVDEIITNMDCDTMFQKLITQKWVAEDDHGNVSDTCIQSLYIERFPLDDVDGPVMDTSLYCDSGYLEDANGNPHPDATGVPQLGVLPLWPMTDFFCNLTVEYRDIDLGTVGCTRKILRQWTVREWWCRTDDERGFQQFIYITDTVGPVLNIGPDTIYAKAGRRSCDALVDLPVAFVDDACHDVDRVDMQYPGGFSGDQNGGQVRLGVGFNTVYYRAYDECYNETIDSIIVMIEDQVAPIAICEQNTVISLDNDGIVHVYAQAFDDGSFDECALEKMEVRRMTDNCNGGTDEWGDYVEFCCADLNQTIMVAFRVTDKSGNMGTCMVSATVQDKLPPRFTPLPDITVDCRFDLDSSRVSTAFGTYVTADSQRRDIVIDDPYVEFDGPALDGLVTDNCPPVMRDSFDFGAIDNCGQGFLKRYFWFTDPSGNVVHTDTQTITVINHEPFIGAQIIWPLHVDTMNVCGANNLRPDLLPEAQAFPRFIDEDECSLVGYDYKDELIDASIGSEACFKIIRTWTVIDWCQKEKNVHMKWSYDQVIENINTIAPEITSPCEDTVRCVYNATCEPDTFELRATATDSCTAEEDLFWTYKIDLDSDGSFDIIENGDDATGLYPIGIHRIKWIVEDLCGNQDSCAYTFELRNCKAPTAYCRNGVVAELTPMDLDNDGTPDTEMAEVWASDFDENSGHVCGHPVVLSFSSDTSDKVRMYDCDSLTPPNRPVTIWVTDKITGEVSRCQTFVLVQDNNNAAVCDSTTFGGGVISGQLYTEDDQMIRDMMVDLTNSGLNGVMTDIDGHYEFSSMPFGGSYEVIPNSNMDFFNGVSTADIVAIQRHLLGKQELASPYKLIAADINKSETVSAADISELRKFILGLYNEFPNNNSWRFVDQDYNFPDPKNPWVEIFPETYDIDPFHRDMDIDFIGVKIGDVNGDVDLGGYNQNSPRGVRHLMLEDGEISTGNTYEVMITMEELSQMAGYQFTLEWKSEYLELIEIVPNLGVGMNLSNFGLNRIEDGIITTSWNKGAKEISDDEERLFLLRFRGVKRGKLSEVMAVSSQITKKECYVGDLSQVEDIELKFTGGETSKYFALYQNEPNPWGDQTTISFHLPEAQMARLTIFDENGREIRVVEAAYERGHNEILIQKGDLLIGGLMYYRLETKDHVATRKMILID